MKPCHLATLAGGLLAMSPPVVAQDTRPAALPPRPPAEPPPPAQVAPAPPIRFNFELPPDMTVEEAVAFISTQSGERVNVVWTAESAQVRLPAFRLHEVTVREILSALTAAGHAEQAQGRLGYEFREVPEADNIFIFSTLPPRGPLAGPRPVAFVDGRLSQPPGEAMPPPAKSSQFFDLQDLLAHEHKVEDLTTAIRTAWNAAAKEAEAPPADALRYHQETALLIATGDPEQLASARAILELLKARHQPSQDSKDQKILSLHREVDELGKENARLNARLATAREENDRIAAKMREQITTLEIELAKARATR